MASKRIENAVKRERTSKEYARNYLEYEEDVKGHFEFDTKILDSIFVKKGSLFDATVGTGRHIVHFAKRGFEVYGNDYNKFMLKISKKNISENGLSAVFYNYDISDLSKIKSNSFDYVIAMYSSFGCIPTYAKRQKSMDELYRITKKNGIVVAHAHNRLAGLKEPDMFSWLFKTYFFREKDLELGDYYFYHSKILKGTYMHWFGHREFNSLFADSGFKVIKRVYLNSKEDNYYKGIFKKIFSGGFIFIGKKV